MPLLTRKSLNSRKIVTESAPAKINLYLHVKNKRADGYHNLDSLVVFSDFGDSISVENSNQLSLSITGLFAHFLPKQSGNLVIKAAQKLQEAVGSTKGASIVLVKNLPVASGIGGGSSDAAATLRALSKLWNITISAKKIKMLALTLGADVPVCLNPIKTNTARHHPNTSFGIPNVATLKNIGKCCIAS